MINTIRADIYKLFHSKGFWITQILLIALIIASILSKTIGSVGVNTSEVDSSQAGNAVPWDGVQTLFNMSFMAFFLVYFLISLFVISIGQDLTKGTLKNLFSSGVSRGQFFLSKYLVFNVIVLIQFIFYYGVSFITASLVHGVGVLPADFFERFFGTFAMQFLFVQAVFAVGVLVLYMTFSTVWPTLAIIIFPMVIALLGTVTKFDGFQYLDFQGAVSTAGALPHKLMFGLIPSAFAVIIVLVGSAYMYFQKKDL
jgi:ABC-2 type transport system permease protein